MRLGKRWRELEESGRKSREGEERRKETDKGIENSG